MHDIKSYTVLTEGFILGAYYKAGLPIRLNERQALEFLREGRIGKSGPKTAPKAASPKD